MIASSLPATLTRGAEEIGQTDGEVFVRCAFPYKAIVNFLISRVIVSMSLHEVFLWRVRFWLRMNAGGVLNTCKSNGILRSLLLGESGERVSNA